MANRYVRSTNGTANADNGTTWALAKTTLAGASAIDTVGDFIFLSQAHAESSATAQTIALAGVSSNPVKVVGGDDSAEPPTTVSSAPTVTTTSGAITINGAAYVYGIGFVSAAAIALNAGADNVAQVYENCAFRTNSASSSGSINAGASNTQTKSVHLKNCSMRFSGANNQVIASGAALIIDGGSVLSGSTTPSNLFVNSSDRSYGSINISGFDFSALSSTFNIFSQNVSSVAAPAIATVKNVVRNSKLPASWAGLLVSGVNGVGQRYEMHNCDSADTNYRLWVEDYAGSIKSETTLVRTGGASDGVTGYSFKMTTTANANALVAPLVSPEIAVWNDAVGSSKTVTVEILHDSATNLTDGEIWLEVQYLGTSGFPLSSFVSDAKADVLATAADQTTSSETWTTTGMTNPNKQKLSVTFTPQEAGYFQVKVYLAKASKTVYVCPKLTVS
jgi:hypothetical protein